MGETGVNNVDFKLISLNARGIRDLKKRKAIFSWINKQKADIAFLQETYSTSDVIDQWRFQWPGKMYYSHGTNHSKGVIILINKNLQFELKAEIHDVDGRYVLIDALVQDSPFLLVNIYAPNNMSEQCTFFSNMLAVLDEHNFSSGSQLIFGGDFNVHLDAELDNSGGRIEKKSSVKNIEEIKFSYDLIDIWRVRNPDKKQYTWRQKRPVVQRRLDFWLISDGLQDFVEHTDIIPSIKSDHSAITLRINSIDEHARGPSHWYFNSSLLDDENYVGLISSKYDEWLNEFKEVHDKRLLWDLVKYRIRQITISYSKQKAKERRNKLSDIENKLKESEKLCATDPTEKNIEDFQKQKTEYDSLFDYIIQGNIIRSRATWYEKGEKNNKYFLNLENTRKTKNCIRKIFNSDEQLVIDSKGIMMELKYFYQDLYQNKDASIGEQLVDDIKSFTENLSIPKLPDHLQTLCEGQLSYQECYNALQTFKNNKSPGNDGLTVEFYKIFWPILGNLLVDSLNTAHIQGKLSNSQRQAIIRLIEKKDKDRRYIENWRPISLLNVDYKIGSKALALRLEKVLPNIIHENQCAYVKGRTIFDAVRSINDVMEYTKLQNTPGLMTTFDFKKAFDSISWQFLFETLRAFNFGNSFVRWVEVLYSDISSCVMNNGFTSDIFQIKRGVRQGDPLSPYLFIIALEVVNIAIRDSREIEGIEVGKSNVKLNVFADDLTTFVKNVKSFRTLSILLEKFGNISGLKLNEEKTEAYWLGSLHQSAVDIGIEKINKPMKILGVYFTYDWKKYQELNFENIIKTINKSIYAWQWRNLTLIGRIQIIKTFAIPKFMFRAAQLSLTKDIIKEVNTVLFRFIWRGKDKVKRLSLISDYKEGGLRMPHIDTIVKTQRIMCLEKYSQVDNCSWKYFLNYYLRDVGGPFLLQCNYDTASLPKNIPKFYRECLNEWENYRRKQVSSLSDVLEQIIWNNKFIKIGGQSLYRNTLVRKGIVKMSDILTSRGKLKPWNTLKNKNITNSEYFLLMSIFDTIPADWKTFLKGGLSAQGLPSDNDTRTTLPSSSKTIYWDLIKRIEIAPTAKRKYEVLYPTLDLSWEDIYLLPRCTTLDSKAREFQYKLLNRIIYTNKILHKMGKVASPMCSFCGKSDESLEHLFIHCEITCNFWLSVTNWLERHGMFLHDLSAADITFGLVRKEYILINHVILLAKQIIYQCRCLNIKPSLILLIAKIKYTYKLESLIAKRQNSLDIHNKKWQLLFSIL